MHCGAPPVDEPQVCVAPRNVYKPLATQHFKGCDNVCTFQRRAQHNRGTKMSETTKEEILYKDMSARQKVVFLAKVFVFIVSGGFVYPTLWVD